MPQRTVRGFSRSALLKIAGGGLALAAGLEGGVAWAAGPAPRSSRVFDSNWVPGEVDRARSG
jgi:hypothetical protein